MLADKDIAHLKTLSEKEPLVKILFDFYCGTTMDGVKAIKNTLNLKLMELNKELCSPSANYDITLGLISEIARTLKKLPKPDVEEKNEKEDSEKTSGGKRKSVFDKASDEGRK